MATKKLKKIRYVRFCSISLQFPSCSFCYRPLFPSIPLVSRNPFMYIRLLRAVFQVSVRADSHRRGEAHAFDATLTCFASTFRARRSLSCLKYIERSLRISSSNSRCKDSSCTCLTVLHFASCCPCWSYFKPARYQLDKLTASLSQNHPIPIPILL